MMQKDSCACSSEALELFSVPPTNITLEDGKWVEYYPVSTVSTQSAPIEFEIKGQGDEYLDLSQTYVYVEAQILKQDGTALADDSQITPANNLLHSLFTEIDCSLNGKVITPGTDTYPYRAYLEKLLSYSDETSKHQLNATCLWHKDQAGRFEKLNPHTDEAVDKNFGLTERHERIAESRSFNMMDRLHLDLFEQKRYLPNGIDVRLRFNRSREPFYMMCGDGESGYVKILQMYLVVRKVKPIATLLNQLNEQMNATTAKYPLRRVEVKTFTIPAGTRSKITDNLFQGQMPKRIVIGMVTNAAFNGDVKKNPFNFQHFNTNKVDVSINGESLGTRPLEPDFENNLYLRSYLSMYQGLGRLGEDWSPAVTFISYRKGYTLWCFDLTADQDNDQSKMHWIKTGNLRIELQFAQALAESVNCIVYGEFDNVLEINKQREVAIDY